jgi:hypothetical protein
MLEGTWLAIVLANAWSCAATDGVLCHVLEAMLEGTWLAIVLANAWSCAVL